MMAASASPAQYLIDRLAMETRVLSKLPVDAVRTNVTRQVAGACFSYVAPTPLPGVKLVAYSPSCLRLIGLDAKEVPACADTYASRLAGNTLFTGSTPAAHCYCGHQFGSFAGQLGDGAAILLGDVPAVGHSFSNEAAPPGEDERVEVQLKGAGMTPYSRSADGRKVFRSSLREFLCSEFMHGLGIPTTRAAALVLSTATVERDPLYTGNVVAENCCVVSRVAPSFIRFGSFEICKPMDATTDRQGPSAGDLTPLLALYDYLMSDLYKGIADAASPATTPVSQRRLDTCVPIMSEIVRRTAALVAMWQAVGFTHGVLNTDNMSILGLTIDYGPYGFQHYFDEDYVPNQSDDSGRYRYSRQPAMCRWNLERLVDAWALMFPAKEAALRAAIADNYDAAFRSKWIELMRGKLGLCHSSGADDETVERVASAVFKAMQTTHADMTNVFLALGEYEPESIRSARATAAHPSSDAVTAALRSEQEFRADIVKRIAAKCQSIDGVRALTSRKMRASRSMMPPEQVEGMLRLREENPDMFARVFPGAPPQALYEHLLGERAKQSRFNELKAAFDAMRPMTDDILASQHVSTWTEALSEYWSIVSRLHYANACERHATMERSNPRFVLLQWVAQQAIAQVEDRSSGSTGSSSPWGSIGGYATVQRLVERLLKPFDESPLDREPPFDKPPENHDKICVSCSS